MTSINSKSKLRRGRIFPEHHPSPEELQRRKTKDKIFAERCRVIFDCVQPDLIQDRYDCFIIIKPDSGDYFIDSDEHIARNKAHEKHPEKKCLIMRINETGACSRL